MKKLKNKYTFFEKCKMFVWLFRSKLIDKNSRLFRFPIIIRGKKFIDFGSNITTGVGCRFDSFAPKNGKKSLVFGKNVQLNDYVHIVSMGKVSIGDNVLMASYIFISDNSHGIYKGGKYDSSPLVPPIDREYHIGVISVGDNTWIGEGVIIMPNVNIGKGCVIGAHSVVSTSIPDYSVAVGSPAKVIKQYNFETQKWEKVKS